MMRTAGLTEIEVLSGKLVDLLHPDVRDINLWDMVNSLSRTCRFNGNVPYHYSNAQHSCIVAGLLDREDRVHGLLHDAPEYLLGDLSRPLKQTLKLLCPDFPRAWRELEDKAERAIYVKVGVPLPTDEQRERVKRADLVALAIEQREILGSVNLWNLPYPAPSMSIFPADANAAFAMFADALNDAGIDLLYRSTCY